MRDFLPGVKVSSPGHVLFWFDPAPGSSRQRRQAAAIFVSPAQGLNPMAVLRHDRRWTAETPGWRRRLNRTESKATRLGAGAVRGCAWRRGQWRWTEAVVKRCTERIRESTARSHGESRNPTAQHALIPTIADHSPEMLPLHMVLRCRRERPLCLHELGGLWMEPHLCRPLEQPFTRLTVPCRVAHFLISPDQAGQ